MNNIVIPWLAEIGIITWRDVKNKSRPPLPSEILATFVVFGAFSIVSLREPRIGSLLGWGIVVATFLNVFDPQNPQIVLGSTQSNMFQAQQSAQPHPQTGQAGIGKTRPY